MTWASVIAVLVQLFGPLLVEWLKKLLDDAAKEMEYVPSGDSFSFALELSDLFERARGKVWWFQFRKRAAVKLAEKAALNRADEIRRGVMGRPTVLTPLTADERIALGAALS